MSADHSTRGNLDEILHLAFAGMERCLQAGDSWDPDAFLAEHPDLAADDDRVVDLLLQEYLLRRRLGQALDPTDWFRRFPRWQDKVQRRLQSIQTLDGRPAVPDPLAQTEDHGGRSSGVWDEIIPELGRHEVHEEIGRGAMGVVHRAVDLVLNRPVALKKIVPRQGLLETPEAMRRFYREARAAARLRHPNIIAIHGMGLHQGRHCFTMPLLTGGSLASRRDDLRGDPRRVVALMEKIARAVQYAHDQGVIHRDLKPANILLDEQGEPFVADFGLAKVLDGDADASMPGQRLGTPAYMSPEQAAGHTWKVAAPTDVWSLGVILYEMLTGRRPFAGPSTEGVLEQVMTGAPARPTAVHPGLPADLETILLRCLEKDPEKRYLTAGAFADDLARWLRSEPIAPAPARMRRRKWVGLAAVVGLLLLALAAVGVWRLLGTIKPPQPPTLHALVPSVDSDDADDPDDLAALMKDYKAGKKVTLVGEMGPPRWYRWPLGSQKNGSPWSKRAALPLETVDGILLLELLPPDKDRGAFRMEAEVKLDRVNAGWVGLYCERCERMSGSRAHWFTSLVYADDGAFKGQVELRRQYSGGDPYVNFNAKFGEPLADPRPQWRKLALEMRSGAVRYSWGEKEKEIPRDELSAHDAMLAFEVMSAKLPPLPPLDPGGGLGLYLEYARAMFRNVTVQALPNP